MACPDNDKIADIINERVYAGAPDGDMVGVEEAADEITKLFSDEIARLKQRESDLLSANNRYLERARGAEHQRGLLAQSLGEVLVATGICRPEVSLTGPELLLLANSYVKSEEAQPDAS